MHSDMNKKIQYLSSKGEKMRKTSIGAIRIILAMILTACGSNGSAASSSTSSANTGSGGTSRATSRTTVLAVGTFKLEGTPQAVDKNMAAKLLPLWQLMTQLNASSSTAPQEVTAVEDDIQTTMTSQQVQAIQGMQITQRDVFTVLQQTGAASFGAGQNGSTRGGNNNRGGGNGGGGLGFLFGGGPGGAPGGGVPRAGSGTPTAGGSGFSSGASTTVLITQLIKLLESKIQGG
jgi:hypothetical protein